MVRIAVGAANMADRAEFTDRSCDLQMRWVVLPHEAQLDQRTPSRYLCCNDTLSIDDVSRQWFFAQNEGAALDSGNGEIGVRVVRRRDDDGVKARICGNPQGVSRCRCIAEASSIKGGGRDDIGNDGDLDAIDRHEILDVLTAHAACADHSNSHCHRPNDTRHHRVRELFAHRVPRTSTKSLEN
jgi:hypothetical protein